MGLEDLAGRMFRTTSRWASTGLLHGYFSKVEVQGLDYLKTPGPKIIAANHMGDMFDPIVFWTYLGRALNDNVRFAAKKELFDPSWKLLWLNGPAMRAFGCIPVDRKNPGNIIDEFAKALENNGRYDGTLVIYFEGTSTPKGVLVGKAKTGFARTALRLSPEHTPSIIPASIGYRDGNPRTAYGAEVAAELLPPVDIAQWKARHDAGGTPAEQYAVAQDLAGHVRSLVVADLERKGFKESPGIEGIY
jgi:1-acyl-sn-glycerol-3-phosphate acyltransferase